MQTRMDALRSGIEVLDLAITDVHPPKGEEDVQTAEGVKRGPASAYEDVVAAIEDRERIINISEAYKSARTNQAIGEAAANKFAAQAYRANTIDKASGERDRRAKLIEQFTRHQEVGQNWMRYQALGETLPGVNKVILGSKVENPVIWQPGKDGNLPRPVSNNP